MKLKKLWDKIVKEFTKDRFWLAYVMAILIVIFIGYFDTVAAHSGVFGTYEAYTAANYTKGWWNVFFFIGACFILLIPLCYYLFYRQDKSETFAILSTSIILWQTGLADLTYFWVQFKPVPATLPWLANSPFMSLFGTTPISLYIGVIGGFILSFGVAKFLKEVM